MNSETLFLKRCNWNIYFLINNQAKQMLFKYNFFVVVDAIKLPNVQLKFELL